MNRETQNYISYIVVFGCALGFGGALLDAIKLPYVGFTVATPWVITVITINKLVLAKPLSVTHMYSIAGVIAVFTLYFGPPSILGVSAILAGFAFDLGSRFRTSSITVVDLMIGHLFATVVGFTLVWLIYLVQLPDLAESLIELFIVAGIWHYAVCLVVVIVLFRALPPSKPNSQIRSIRDSIGSLD